MKFSRLTGRKTCDRIRTKGRIWKGKTMVIRWMPLKQEVVSHQQQAVYVGTYAPGTLHTSAVKRNRMRRRCREAFRLSIQKYHRISPMQLLLCPKIASLNAPFTDIQSDIISFLSSRSSHA